MSVHPSAWTPIGLFPIGTAILTAILWTSLFRCSRNERLVPFEA